MSSLDSVCTFFSDIERPLLGLLNDGFFFSKKISVKTKNAAGVEWSVDGDLSSRGSQGSMSIAYNDPAGLSIEQMRIRTDGRVLGEASFQVSDSFKLTACIEDGRQEPGKPLYSFGKLGLDYCVENFSAQTDLDVVNGPSLQGCALLSFPYLRLGGEFLCNTHLEDKRKHPELLDLNVGMSVLGSEWAASVRTTNLLGNIRLGYLCNISRTVDVGVMVDYRILYNDQSLLVGGIYRPDAFTEVKSRIDSDAIVSASIKQRITDVMQLTLCAEVDAKEFGLDGHKFGVGLQFE
mmetsp:Transcript_16776/g.25209  ORF Transcript_16776/g.25209 Transcript_16776/m.25209 type:complete len:292 (-) Transcript_16776:82-957(-)